MFSLELLHQYKKRKSSLIISNIIKSGAMRYFLRDSRTSFEIAVVNEPSVLEPLKFYCMFVSFLL